ncbi:MAG: hypothetical protein R2746_00725 [Acidimicrobiales bacterium]|nr:hypothetical protein [Actinomycetota bacterium]
MPSERPDSPGRRTLWLVVACAVVAVVGGVALGDRLPPPDITLDAARLQQRGDLLDLRTVLGGRAKDGTRFQLWFTLQAADANDVTWRSDTVTGSFERDAHQVVEAQEQVQVPPGEYRVDVWLHQKRRSAFIHADHVVSSITIGGPPVAEVRPGPIGPITADLSDLVMSDQTPVWLVGSVRVRNRGPASVGLDLSIGLLEDPTDGRNLLGGDVLWIRTIPVAVAGDSATDAPIDLVPAPPAGSYRPVVVIRRQGQVVDRVATGTATEVAAPTLAEHRGATTGDGTGPVTVTEVRAPGDVGTGGPLTVTAVVANTSPQPQDVRVWWILDRPDARRGRHLAEGVPQTTVLEPGERRTFTLEGAVDAPAGRQDLSVVVHALDPARGRRVPVDQAWRPGGLVIRGS